MFVYFITGVILFVVAWGVLTPDIPPINGIYAQPGIVIQNETYLSHAILFTPLHLMILNIFIHLNYCNLKVNLFEKDCIPTSTPWENIFFSLYPIFNKNSMELI